MILNPYLIIFPYNSQFLILNSFNGLLYSFNSPAKKAIDYISSITSAQKRRLNKQEKMFLRYLIDQKIIFNDKKAIEDNIKKTIGDIQRNHKKEPIEIYINTTNLCNLACEYCVNRHTRQRKFTHLLSIDKVQKIFAAIDSLHKKEPDNFPEYITLSGGEPLFCSEKILNEIFVQAEKRGIKIAMFTNGTLIHKRKYFFEHFNNIYYIQVTLDGPASIHNKTRYWSANPKKSYSCSIEAIKYLLTLGVNIRIRININKKNLAYLPILVKSFFNFGWINNKLVEFELARVDNYHRPTIYDYPSISSLLTDSAKLKDRKTVEFIYSHFRYPVLIKSIIDILSHKYSGPITRDFLYCSALKGNQFCFAPDGKTYSCSLGAGNEAFCIGEYYPNKSVNYNNILYLQNRSSLKMKKCLDCNAVFYCQGGCPYASLTKNRNLFSPVCEEQEIELNNIFNLVSKYHPSFSLGSLA